MWGERVSGQFEQVTAAKASLAHVLRSTGFKTTRGLQSKRVGGRSRKRKRQQLLRRTSAPAALSGSHLAGFLFHTTTL